MIDKRFLTRSEHQVMLLLWSLKDKGGFTKDILDGYSEPKPAYTTLATFLKILTRKGFVKASKVGAMLYYTPKISKMDYCKIVMEKANEDYFEKDTVAFIKFILKNNKLTPEQKEELMSAIG